MSLKVGDKVRVKSKEWYDQQNFINVAQCVLDCCGKIATITEVKANGYSLDIGSKNIRWVESCIEPISDGCVSTDEDYKLYIPSGKELKKSVTVNVPSDMEVSTEEYNGKITINVQHKEEKVEEQKFKNGDIIYVEEIKKNFLSIRLATEEEQKQLFESLAKQKELSWNAEERKFEYDKVRVKMGDRYWHITELGNVTYGPDYYSYGYYGPYDNILYNLRNHFGTEELENKELPKWKKFLKNLNIK